MINNYRNNCKQRSLKSLISYLPKFIHFIKTLKSKLSESKEQSNKCILNCDLADAPNEFLQFNY